MNCEDLIKGHQEAFANIIATAIINSCKTEEEVVQKFTLLNAAFTSSSAAAKAAENSTNSYTADKSDKSCEKNFLKTLDFLNDITKELVKLGKEREGSK